MANRRKAAEPMITTSFRAEETAVRDMHAIANELAAELRGRLRDPRAKVTAGDVQRLALHLLRSTLEHDPDGTRAKLLEALTDGPCGGRTHGLGITDGTLPRQADAGDGVSDHPIEDRSGGRCTLVEDEHGHRIVARLDDLEVPL